MNLKKIISEKSYSPALLLLLTLLLAIWLRPEMDIYGLIYLLIWFLILASGGLLFRVFFIWYKSGRLKVVSTILFSFVLTLILWVITLRINSLILAPSLASSNILISFVFVAVYLFSTYRFNNLFSAKDTALAQKDKELSIKVLELDYIKNQFNPHYLFNSLNNVAATIMVNRDLALDYTYKLAEMLRYQTDLSDRESVEIKGEEAFIRNFIDVERLRLGDRCAIEFNSEIKAPEIFIPPFLLHPLVESALRRSRGLNGKSSLSIRIIADVEMISMKISYVVPENPADAGDNKRGVELVSKRLILFYPEKHRLSETQKNGIKEIDLLINL
ncbi:MAG: histidine kinase [Lentimicrobium sp.]|nr:histidine kinase [Lentimicrobium sp.]